MPHRARLAAFRAELTRVDLDGFVVPLTDEHMSEYVGSYAQRLAWLTGFGGSAGSAVVLPAQAAIFTDGRYTLQVREQVSADAWDYVSVPQGNIANWLRVQVGEGDRIGYDPWLHTNGWVIDTAAALEDRGASLVPVETNPIDAVWVDRPAPSSAKLVVHDDAYAGRSAAAKRAGIADWLGEQDADAVVLTALDSIAWTLNIRGRDIAHTPVALSYAIITSDGRTDLFVAPDKIDDAVRQHLGDAVRLYDRAAFAGALRGYTGKRIAVDPARAVAAIFDTLRTAGATVLPLRDPVVLAKAQKNTAEIAGHRAASVRDGVALSRFLRWVETQAPSGKVTELSAAAKLLAFRQDTGRLLDTSFDTISATGAHGASPHYQVTEHSNAPLRPGELFLIDSGGQYLDGTTDVTRVLPIGAPTEEMRDRFTRVLKGHIAIASAIFPEGTSGAQIDAFARRPLWEAGLDFAHGAGHGVGSYLSVHEGPQRIAAPRSSGDAALEPLRAGMILSNEPGYYKNGEYGIRIENLVVTVPIDVAGGDADRAMLGFETLTFAPIERDLIDTALLTREERAWLDTYHRTVIAKIGPVLEDEDRGWLEAKCAPLRSSPDFKGNR